MWPSPSGSPSRSTAPLKRVSRPSSETGVEPVQLPSELAPQLGVLVERPLSRSKVWYTSAPASVPTSPATPTAGTIAPRCGRPLANRAVKAVAALTWQAAGQAGRVGAVGQGVMAVGVGAHAVERRGVGLQEASERRVVVPRGEPVPA